MFRPLTAVLAASVLFTSFAGAEETEKPRTLTRKNAQRRLIEPKKQAPTQRSGQTQVRKVDPSRLQGFSRQDSEIAAKCGKFKATYTPGTFAKIAADAAAWKSFAAQAVKDTANENTDYFLVATAFLKAPTAQRFAAVARFLPGGRTELNFDNLSEANGCFQILSGLIKTGKLKPGATQALDFVRYLLRSAVITMEDVRGRWSVTCDACKLGFGSDDCEANNPGCGQRIGGKGFTRVKPMVLKRRTTK